MAPSKIIVVGAAWYNDWARLYAHAFRRMGFATDIVFNNSMPAPLGGEQESVTALFERAKARVRKASPRFFATLKHWRVRLSERELLGRVRACRNLESVLVIFVWTPGSEATLQKLREIKNVRLVLWLGEPSIRDAHWAGTFKYFDHLFIVDDGLWMDTLPSAFQGKFKLLPLSSDETTFKPV